MYDLSCMLVESRPFVVLDGLPGLYGLKYDSATACGLLLYLCSYKLDDSATTPKKGKVDFVTPKASLVKGNGQFCNRCKQVGHIEKNYKTNKNKLPIVSSIKFDSCYMFYKSANSVKAKFIGTPIVSPKKKAIWVPKILVTNLQGPKQVWAPKRN